jgi:hypothetical protein
LRYARKRIENFDETGMGVVVKKAGKPLSTLLGGWETGRGKRGNGMGGYDKKERCTRGKRFFTLVHLITVNFQWYGNLCYSFISFGS